jgi:glycosyltransferase involved in cell wall biosynthesis
LTAAEALSHGTPVVASNIGGLTETVDDGVDGYLVDAGDTIAMANRVRALARKPEVARSMGASGRRKVRQKFSEEKYYEAVLAEYYRILGK